MHTLKLQSNGPNIIEQYSGWYTAVGEWTFDTARKGQRGLRPQFTFYLPFVALVIHWIQLMNFCSPLCLIVDFIFLVNVEKQMLKISVAMSAYAFCNCLYIYVCVDAYFLGLNNRNVLCIWCIFYFWLLVTAVAIYTVSQKIKPLDVC